MVQLFGRITKDATVTEIKSGKKVANFSIALDDSYRNKEGEKVDLVTYVNCAYWVNPEKVATFLTKGKLVQVNGRLSVNAYTNLKGDAVGTINFHVNTLKPFGKGSEESEPAAAKPADKGKKKITTDTTAEVTEPIDDLPF